MKQQKNKFNGLSVLEWEWKGCDILLKILQKVALILSIIVAFYSLVTGSFDLFPLIIVFQVLSLVFITVHDFKEGRKTKGMLTSIALLVIFLYSINLLLN